MKSIKKFLFVIILLLILGVSKVYAKEKVKVYIFEAGGCPYCEAQIEYLKKLPGYGTKFEIIIKELYVDHIDWEYGKDYDLGVKVAEAFYKEGFTNASYYGTPFVVISDIYAETTYSESLDKIIDAAYQEGDKDAVSCIAQGKTNCIRPKGDTTTIGSDTTTPSDPEPIAPSDDGADTYKNTSSSKDSSVNTFVIVLLSSLLGVSVIGNIVLTILVVKKRNKE